jgi:hypothetical protein
MLVHVLLPTRAMSGQHHMFIQWNKDHWKQVSPYLTFVHLWDVMDISIDVNCELVGRRLMRTISDE